MDYQISWLSPLPPQQLLASPGSSHPAAANSFSRYRIMWGPRKEEPVDASMYNTEAGFSPIPDLQQSDVRVVDKVSVWTPSNPSLPPSPQPLNCTTPLGQVLSSQRDRDTPWALGVHLLMNMRFNYVCWQYACVLILSIVWTTILGLIFTTHTVRQSWLRTLFCKTTARWDIMCSCNILGNNAADFSRARWSW